MRLGFVHPALIHVDVSEDVLRLLRSWLPPEMFLNRLLRPTIVFLPVESPSDIEPRDAEIF